MFKTKVIRKFFVVRSNGFRPETDNKAKLRQDFRDIDIGATSSVHDKLRTLLGVKVTAFDADSTPAYVGTG